MNFDRLTCYLDSLEATYGIPAVDCKITKGYETIYRHSVGFANEEKTRPVSATDLYYVYSCTKVITVTAAMQLCEQGKLSLNDRVDAYLPEFSELAYAPDFPIGVQPVRWPTCDDRLARVQTPIRILDLFRMTAGLGYDTASREILAQKAESDNLATTRQMMAAIANTPLVCEPGSRWVYSLAHDVLGGVIEVVSGEKLGEYMHRHIFAPLGIEDMHFTLNEDRRARLCAQYCADPTTQSIAPMPPTNRYRLTDAYESGGAGLISTVDAYSRFVEAMANGGVGATGQRILGMDSINELRKNRLEGQMLADFTSGSKVGYGYGLGVRTLMDKAASQSPIGEFGWDGAAGAYALIDPENRIGIFFAEHVFSFGENYRIIHPTLRDLAYEAILSAT